MFLTACSTGPTPTPPPTRLRISGATSMGPALMELAAAFQGANPNVLVEVQGGDTANGWADLQAGRAEIAALSYWDETQTAPQGFALFPVARDPVAIIVHPGNPITNVTTLQLRALFGGEVLDWAALRGATGEPVIVSREDGSGTRAAFEAAIMGDRRVTLNAIVMPTTQAVVDYVAQHRLAVGYVTRDAVNDAVRVAPVEGLLPDRSASGYYLTRTLYLAVRKPAGAATQAFIVFAQNETAQVSWTKHHLSLSGGN